MPDFSNYELEPGFNVYELADRLLPEMGEAMGMPLGSDPTEEEIGALIGHIGPAKTLQDNIGLVQERLDTEADAVTIAANWADRSGALRPVRRAFVDMSPVPEQLDAVVYGGGVANWMLRRTTVTEQFDPENVGTVVLPVGNRVMGEGEHQLVKTLAKRNNRLPTEAEFMREFIAGRLTLAGFKSVEVIPVDDANGDRVLDELFANRESLLDGSVLMAANAPNTIQAAGQLRMAARRADESFDGANRQLFVASDTIQVARNGEGTATHQNPLTALGQIARNALFLHKNA